MKGPPMSAIMVQFFFDPCTRTLRSLLCSASLAAALLADPSAVGAQAQVQQFSSGGSVSPAATPAVGQPPMNSAMREAQAGAQGATLAGPAPVQSTPTNAMTLTLGSGPGSRSSPGGASSPASPGGSPASSGANPVTYDAYGVRSSGRDAASSSSSNSQSPDQPQIR